MFLMLPRFIDGTGTDSEQLLDNVNRTHLVLASGKIVLQKRMQCLARKVKISPKSGKRG